MDERKREDIRREAKSILGRFSKALESIKFKKKEFKKEVGGFREEGDGEKCDNAFRKRMFENAPKTKGDFIIAEKKKW